MTETMPPYDACSPLHHHTLPVRADEPMTAQEVLLWLAGLETDCPNNHALLGSTTEGVPVPIVLCASCYGTNRVPVLPDLREPCPNQQATTLVDSHNRIEHGVYQHKEWLVCTTCQGRTWVPTQGRQAVQDGMVKAGWDLHISHYALTQHREVSFFRFGPKHEEIQAWDADDHIAAMKAMKAAGYGDEHV